MSPTIAVQVPESEGSDLRELAETLASSLEVEPDFVAVHPFDGEALVQVVIMLTTAAYPYFHSWLRARSSAGKGCYIAVKGMKLRGYTSEEVAEILKTIENHMSK